MNPIYDRLPDEIHEQWRQRGRVRLTDFLQPAAAARVLASMREVPHILTRHDVIPFQLALHETTTDGPCEHALGELARWWFSDGMRWVSELVDTPLVPPPSLVSNLITKGGYLDPHTDRIRTRRVAYVMGFTEGAWPWEEGGWLEFLRFVDGDLEVVERLPPGFNTLDLFDLHRADSMHRVTMITEHHERRTVAGWFHDPPGPSPGA